MTISPFITTFLAIMMECVTLIYYTNSVMTYRHSRQISNAVIIIGSTLYYGVCLMQRSILSLAGYFIINFIILRIGFKERTGFILLRLVMLTILMMAGEFIASLMLSLSLNDELFSNISMVDDIIFTLVSKLVYFIGVIMLKRFSVRGEGKYDLRFIALLLVLPISTMLFIFFYGRMSAELDSQNAVIISIIAVLLVISNFIVYAVGDRLIDNSIRLQVAQEMSSKNEIDRVSYNLMKEKYEELRILAHDFNKYCNNIEALLAVDQEEARAQLEKLKNKNNELLLIEYTDNRALNVLLSQKLGECGKAGINMQICVQSVELSFIEESDVVSIFANLIDNAIESCILAENKKIFLNIYTMNDSYAVIRLDNCADTEPLVTDGRLMTRKKNKDIHGIGMESIRCALKRYRGRLRWSYDNDTRMFTTIALMRLPEDI